MHASHALDINTRIGETLPSTFVMMMSGVKKWFLEDQFDQLDNEEWY